MSTVALENRRIASWLDEASRLLAAQGASPYRVHAYRRAAEGVASFPRDVRRVFDADGVKGLDAIPGVGLGIASAIAEILVTQRWHMLERLRGAVDAVTLFQSVPGIGPSLAARIRDELHLDTLEALEIAANDGTLEGVAGVGERRVAAIRASLAQMLGRMRPLGPPAAAAHLPSVGLVLEIDREYLEKSAAGALRTIAPRRFNPEGERWLPVMHASRGPWHFTALFSNTALAHRLGHSQDWVVIYSYDGDHVERQCTVVTERAGPMAGRRVIRGREAECQSWYDNEKDDHAIRENHAA